MSPRLLPPMLRRAVGATHLALSGAVAAMAVAVTLVVVAIPGQATAADGAEVADAAASAFASLRTLLPAANAAFGESQEALGDEAPSPPTACPAPAAEFVDTWGAPRSGGRRHMGVDMMAPHGSPALAPVDGVVRSHYSGLGGLSYYLDGDDGNEYFGTHMATVTAEGRVDAGDQIGTVGATGNAGTPHLHWEVKIGGVESVNPYPFAAELCA